jgi:hypothetical protein
VIITDIVNTASRMIASVLPVRVDGNRGLVDGFCILPITGGIHLLLSLFDEQMSNRNESDQQSKGQINVKERVVRRVILTSYPYFSPLL